MDDAYLTIIYKQFFHSPVTVMIVINLAQQSTIKELYTLSQLMAHAEIQRLTC